MVYVHFNHSFLSRPFSTTGKKLQMINQPTQTSCRQCGTCCTNGGPALHGEDILLLNQGLLTRNKLITIRKGEFAHNPLTDSIQSTSSEIIKIKGSKGSWSCCFFDPVLKSCTIYTSRPLACRTLMCWDTADSQALVEKDLLSRRQILADNEELLECVSQYDTLFSVPDFTDISSQSIDRKKRSLGKLEDLINSDIQYRNEQVQKSSIIQDEEMFLFGRPLFQLLQPFGFTVTQKGSHLQLRVD